MADFFDMMGATPAQKPTALELANDGMARAVEHADAVDQDWSERAYQMLLDYALIHFEFMTENVRVWAHEQGLPTPPDGRAWGAITVRAVRDRIIVRDRYQLTRIPPAHSTPRPVWRSQLYQEAA